MVSLRRRQVIIGGLVGAVAPGIAFSSVSVEKLVLSGRVLDRQGRPLAGASFAVGKDRIATDADGRFVLVTDTRRAEAILPKARRDSEGTWRAAIGLTL